MNIAGFSIRRPTFIGALVAVMLVIGGVSLMRIGVDRFPNVNFPIVVVMTAYRGAGPNEVETQVSKPIEEQMSTIAGLRHISSMNYEGLSLVVAEFDMGGDIKDLEQQSRAKVSMARSAMPEGVDEPILRRADPSDAPIVIASISADLSPRDLYNLADKKIKGELERIDGVSNIDIMGGARREIQVLLDRKKLNDHQVSVTQVAGRIAASSMNIPVGRISRGDRQLSFRSMGEYRTLDQLRRVPVNFIGSDVAVPVSDLGEVVDGAADMTGYAYYNRRPAVFMMIYRQSGANTVKVADEVVAKTREMNLKLGKGLGRPKIAAVVDFAKMIRMNLDDVRMTIIEGIILAVLVVYLFLGSARSTFITTIALPNSLLGSFILMYVMGFTINVITLMALSLVVGLLIDDAIVVRENIWRHMERGATPKEAAIKGTKEVTLAVVATTLTVISVFLPIGFLSGMMGQFFKELGLTIVFAMAISLFDAMTTAPLLSAYLAKKENGKKAGNGRTGRNGKSGFRAMVGAFARVVFIPPQWAAATTRNLMDRLVDGYEVVIRWCLRHRFVVVLAAVLLFVISIFMFMGIKKEFMAPADTGSYQVTIELAPGTSLEATQVVAADVEKTIRIHKENENISMLVGGAGYGGSDNQATFFIEMSDSSKRKVSTTDMKAMVRQLLLKKKGFTFKVADMQIMHTGAESAFNMAIEGDDIPILLATAEKAKKEFSKIPDLVDLDLDFRSGNPEMQFRLDAEKLMALGASTIPVGTELRNMVDGNVPARFRDADDEYDIRVSLKKDQRDLKKWLNEIQVPNNNFNLVRLVDVATPVQASGYTKITRRDRTRYINIMGNIGPKGTIGSVQGDAAKIMKNMKLPPGVTYRFWGSFEYFEEMIQNIIVAMILAVIFMYLILASLYESLLMPFLIMTALPLAFVGAFAALKLTGQNLTMFAMIGLVMLLGLVAKNSILLVDYTMQLMRRGVPRDEAVIQAGRVRLRPIMMTTIALIAGMLPLAFALTEVGKFRQSMGITIIGGLISSLLLTLVLIPAMFGWVDRFRLITRRLFGRPLEREIDLEDKDEYRKQKLLSPERRTASLN